MMDREGRIHQAVGKLDTWLSTMRAPDGYCGPVVHWWEDRLLYAGIGLDWRYEGIILGYLDLFKRTGQESWLEKARRAGEDLAHGQLPTGSFCRSSFEANPYPGGTPHEAACDLALLALAEVLKGRDDPQWQAFAATAEHNVREYLFRVLWDRENGYFWNAPSDPSFVPNKGATTVEALLAWVTLTGKDDWIGRYVLPTLGHILRCQIRTPNDPLDGAIEQARVKRGGTGRFFPYYVARCIPALAKGYTVTGDARYLDGALAAMSFVARQKMADGSFPQVVYASGRVNVYPRWIAAVGDILRAADVVRAYDGSISLDGTLDWLLQGQNANGGIQTARGFASLASQRMPPQLPEFRDILPVCGWADKAFRYLASQVTDAWLPIATKVSAIERPCLYRGQRSRFYEDETTMELWQAGRLTYRWQKGEPWAKIHRIGGWAC